MIDNLVAVAWQVHRDLERIAEALERAERLDRALARIETKLNIVLAREAQIMAAGQEILDAIAAETTAVDSLIAWLNGQVLSGLITEEQKAQILAGINENRAKLEAALTAGVTPA